MDDEGDSTDTDAIVDLLVEWEPAHIEAIREVKADAFGRVQDALVGELKRKKFLGLSIQQCLEIVQKKCTWCGGEVCCYVDYIYLYRLHSHTRRILQ